MGRWVRREWACRLRSPQGAGSSSPVGGAGNSAPETAPQRWEPAGGQGAGQAGLQAGLGSAERCPSSGLLWPLTGWLTRRLPQGGAGRAGAPLGAPVSVCGWQGPLPGAEPGRLGLAALTQLLCPLKSGGFRDHEGDAGGPLGEGRAISPPPPPQASLCSLWGGGGSPRVSLA